MLEHTFDTMCRQHEVHHQINGCSHPDCEQMPEGLSPHGWIWVECNTPEKCEAIKMARFREVQGV